MKKELLFSFASPSRDDLRVYGFRFGKAGGDKIAIVSGLNGDQAAGVFVASQLVRYLEENLQKNPEFIQSEILIIPSVNNFGLNMGHRFWPLDNVDINTMFPGYEKGETTQRIAYKLFAHLQEMNYGIVLEDRKDKATCMPYVKLVGSGLEDVEGAKKFGLPFVHLRKFSPIDSGSLQYNWDVWETKAYSLVFGNQNKIIKNEAQQVLDSLIRFLSSIKAIQASSYGGFNSEVVDRTSIDVVKAKQAGIFKSSVKPGDKVQKDQKLGSIFDPLDGTIKEVLLSSQNGIVTCIYNYPLIHEQTILFRILKV
jgi:predicted deacylase